LKESNGKLGKNFVLVAFLEDNYNNNFCILNTHLKAFDEFEEIRVYQVESIFQMLTKYKIFLDNFKKFKCNSIILCGDFNASPNFKSIENINNFNFNDNILIKFSPVFNYFEQEKEDYEEYSLCIYKENNLIKKAIDYIFFTKNVEILNKQIERKEIDISLGLPSKYFPSDHLYLKIEFRFRK